MEEGGGGLGLHRIIKKNALITSLAELSLAHLVYHAVNFVAYFLKVACKDLRLVICFLIY